MTDKNMTNREIGNLSLVLKDKLNDDVKAFNELTNTGDWYAAMEIIRDIKRTSNAIQMLVAEGERNKTQIMEKLREFSDAIYESGGRVSGK